MTERQFPDRYPSLEQDLLIPRDLGIIGYGIVGEAVAYGFTQTSKGRDRIRYYDKYKPGSPSKEVVQQSEFIFISLPTPMRNDESGIDLSIIEENITQITPLTDHTDKVIIIKSTVVPGTTNSLELKYPHSHFCFNPEFLTEANYRQDFLKAREVIIGANQNLVSRRVAGLYRPRFPRAVIYQTDPTTAEAVKYFRNAFLALKVTFANFFYDYCQTIGIKYEEVKRMAATDPRIVDAHLDVTTARGFGQKCLPKDLTALVGEMNRLGVDASVLEKAWDYNKRIRQTHDWLEIAGAVEGNHALYLKEPSR